MKLMYHADWRGNFGDDLNLPLFNAILPEYQRIMPEKTLYGIGTLLNDVHGKISNALIFGSGYGYGDNISIDWSNSHVFGVRGPVTARKLGLNDDMVIGDPAMFVESIPELMTGKPVNRKKVVALHHKSTELWDFSSNNTTDLYFLDPGLTNIVDYIATIRGADIVFTESLHGAIIASTFGIPFYPVSVKTVLEKKKWSDFYELISLRNFDVQKAPCAPTPLLRRVLISAKARHFFTPGKSGNQLPESYFSEFSRVIDTPSNHARAVNADRELINKIKLRIAAAADRLREYADCNLV